MNGDVKSYRLNDPMPWEEFKAIPEDIQTAYITALREKFNPPDSHIAEMMGVSAWTLSQRLAALGLRLGARKQNVEWDKEGWKAWSGAGADENEPDEVVPESAENPAERKQGADEAVMKTQDAWVALSEANKVAKATPVSGRMTFECSANMALETIAQILDNENVRISVEWEVVEKGGECRAV